jgi:type II secretory pathway component PulF
MNYVPVSDRIVARFYLKIPVLGTVIKNISLAWFIRTFSVSIKAGIDVIHALQLAIGSIQNSYIRHKIGGIISAIAAGSTISEELNRTGLFTNIILNLIRSGELTGNLDTMLDKANTFLQEDIKTSIQRSTILLGPIVFLFVALYFAIQIVGFWQHYFSQLEQLPLP